MILIQSPLINKELVYTVVFLHPSQLKYTSANMAMVCSILLSMMPLKPHGFRIFPWLAPGGGAMGTVALCVAMGVIYGGSWKQSQAGLQLELIRRFFVVHLAPKATQAGNLSWQSFK